MRLSNLNNGTIQQSLSVLWTARGFFYFVLDRPNWCFLVVYSEGQSKRICVEVLLAISPL